MPRPMPEQIHSLRKTGRGLHLARSAFSTYWTVTVTVFVERPYWFVAYKV